jgi:hypothetical protein
MCQLFHSYLQILIHPCAILPAYKYVVYSLVLIIHFLLFILQMKLLHFQRAQGKNVNYNLEEYNWKGL